jgi:hypothetical protein
MTASWTISVGGRVYGPYSLDQMQAFHAENRLADHSLIARAGEEQFRPAVEDPDLAQLFHTEPTAPAAQPAAQPTAPHRFGARNEPEGDGGPSHFVIIADLKSSSTTGLEEEIFSLGTAHRFMPQAWVLSSESPINVVRTALVRKLGKLDALFIVDAVHDKAAWFNFGPESDARIRRMWSRPTEHTPGAEKRALRRN